MTLNDLEPPHPKGGFSEFLVNFLRFPAATHILKVNCAEMAGDGPGQPAYDIFSNLIFDLLNSRSLPYGGLKFEYSFKMHLHVIAVSLH